MVMKPPPVCDVFVGGRHEDPKLWNCYESLALFQEGLSHSTGCPWNLYKFPAVFELSPSHLLGKGWTLQMRHQQHFRTAKNQILSLPQAAALRMKGGCRYKSYPNQCTTRSTVHGEPKICLPCPIMSTSPKKGDFSNSRSQKLGKFMGFNFHLCVSDCLSCW